jgi:RimJ/RimL family protein N-acetyltransferase
VRGFELEAPIRTERLLLRAFEPGDLAAVRAMQTDDDVVRYLEWGPRTSAEIEESLRKKIAATAIHGGGEALSLAAVLPATDEVVGDLVLHCVSEVDERGEIGFIVPPAHGGKGYATEAARALLRIAFDEVGFRRVIGQVESRNVASARVLEKLGMRREAHFVENVFVKGEWQDEMIYAILAREWRAAVS